MPDSHGKPWKTETHCSMASIHVPLYNVCHYLPGPSICFFYFCSLTELLQKCHEIMCEIIFYHCPYVFTFIFNIELYLKKHEKLRPEYFKSCHESEDGCLKCKDL